MDEISETALSERVRMALESADLKKIEELLDPAVQWGPPGDTKSGCHSRAEVLEWWGRGRAQGVRARVTEVIANNDKLLVGLLVRSNSAAEGADGESERWQVMTVGGGRITDIRGYDVREEAAAQVGIR